MRRLAAACLLGVVLLAGCQDASSAPQNGRPASLNIGVGGSVGMAGAAVSQPRTTYGTRP